MADYDCLVRVIPQNATHGQEQEIFDIARDNKNTVCWSYDDAGRITKPGTAVLYNIPQGDQAAFIDFYKQHYPDAVLEWAYTSDWEEPVQPGEWDRYLLCQCASPWGDDVMSGGTTCGSTICNQGCYISNVAMAQRILDIDPDATPGTVDDALSAINGYAGCLALWSAIKTACGIQIAAYHPDGLDAWLDAGNIAMIEVRISTGQHFVLAVERQGNDYLILDPWKCEVALLSDRYSGVVGYRTLEPVESPAPPSNTRGFIGLHLQGNASGVTEFVNVLPSVMKCVFGFERALDIKRASPDTAVILRHVNNDSGTFIYYPDGPLAGARAWIDQFRDSLITITKQLMEIYPGQDPVVYIESVNETYACHATDSNVASRDFDIAFCEAVREMGLPIGPVVFTAPVGNPHETEFEMLVSLARACVDAKGLMGYHNYWRVVNGESKLVSDWPYYAGRWTEIDKVFVSQGVHVNWYGGESGAYESCVDGWKAGSCFSGNWDAYLADILEADAKIATWNAAHGNRFLGAVLFTTSGPGWDSFDIGTAEIAALRAALLERYPNV